LLQHLLEHHRELGSDYPSGTRYQQNMRLDHRLAPPGALKTEVAVVAIVALPIIEVAAEAKNPAVTTRLTAHTRNPWAVSRKYTSSV
jgi:hypothetical protein